MLAIRKSIFLIFIGLQTDRLIDLLEVVLGEFPLGGFGVGIDLLGAGGAGDDGGDFGAGKEPGEGKLADGMVALLGPLAQRAHLAERLGVELGLHALVAPGAGVGRRRLAFLVFAGQD